jgi:oxygen-independent coproporphyrinogen-3 oxidase
VKVGGGRYTNTRSAEGYMAALEQGRLPEKTEALSPSELLSERLMLGLRLTEGVDLEAVCAEFGTASGPVLSKARRLVVGGWATLEGARLTLTERGLDLHTEAAARLI